MVNKTFSRRNILAVIILSVVSVALGLVKIPGPVGSIALDSAPAFFAALFFTPLVGGLIGLIGHLGSSATAGFPLGGVHGYISVEMFLWILAFGYLVREKKTIPMLLLASAVAILLNSVVGPLLTTFTPCYNMDYSEIKELKIMPVLAIATAINITLAIVAYFLIGKIKRPDLE